MGAPSLCARPLVLEAAPAIDAPPALKAAPAIDAPPALKAPPAHAPSSAPSTCVRAAASCPRWFFPLPPYVDEKPTVGAQPKNYRDALCGKQMLIFNEALCGYYQQHCLTAVQCPPADGETARASSANSCVDLTPNCLSWARRGECTANEAFMKQECAQSCGACPAHHPRPLLGAPTTTCVDDQSEGSCQSLAALGACTTQRAHMQEACRRTCQFCNASAFAFPEGKEPGREDTAAHACPDGSDLGGGEVLVEAKGAETNAKLAVEDGGSASEPMATAAAHAIDGEGGGDESPLHADQGPVAEGAPRVARPRPAKHTEGQRGAVDNGGSGGGGGTPTGASRRSGALRDAVALDVSLASWPFLMVQGLFFVLAGYLLRGWLDRRTKRRRNAMTAPHGAGGFPGPSSAAARYR